MDAEWGKLSNETLSCKGRSRTSHHAVITPRTAPAIVPVRPPITPTTVIEVSAVGIEAPRKTRGMAPAHPTVLAAIHPRAFRA